MTFFDTMREHILNNMKEQGWKNSDKFLDSLPEIISCAETNIQNLLTHLPKQGGSSGPSK